MSPTTGLAQRPTTFGTHSGGESLGALLATIRTGDIDSLHASFDVPTIFAEMPWTADSVAVIDEADADADAHGLQYVLEVALAKDVLDGLVGANGQPTDVECVEAVAAYSVTGLAGTSVQAPWVSRCLAC